MQTQIVKKVPSLKAGYIDPCFIASSEFNGPKLWELDNENLARGKTLEEKEDICAKSLYKADIKVAARIARYLKNL
jgi:hypothetical protein